MVSVVSVFLRNVKIQTDGVYQIDRYSFRDDVKPSENVAKRVFRVPLQQIRVDYHFVNGRITNNTKIYERDGSYTSMHVCWTSLY